MSSAAAFYPHSQLNACFATAFEDASRLRVHVQRSGSVILLQVGGDVDISNVASWRCLLAELSKATATPGALVIDTDALDFLGLCAYTALADTAEECRRRGVDLRLVSAKQTIPRIVALCDWEAELPVYPDVFAAMHA